MARVVVKNALVGLLVLAVFALFFTLWFLLPRVRTLQRLVAGASEEDRTA